MLRALACILVGTAAVSASPGKHYLTEFGRRILARADQVVEASVSSVQPAFRGITTARLKVIRRLDGFDRKTELVVMYVDDLTAPDAFGARLERSKVAFRKKGATKDTKDEQKGEIKGGRTGVRLARGETGLFFLARKGATYSMMNLIPAADPLYKAKRARLDEIFKIEGVPALDLRVKRAKAIFLDSLGSKNDWLRGNSAREVLVLAARYPDVFTRPEAERLVRLMRDEKQPPIRAALERTVRILDPDAALAFAQRAEEAERKKFGERLARERERIDKLKVPELKATDIYRVGRIMGRAATGLVALYLDDEEALVRERAAQTLAEFGGPSCRVALRDALEDEKNPAVAGAMIFALGAQADPDAVGLLGKRLADPKLERTTIHALARIGTVAAREALAKHKVVASAPVAELIGTLLAEEPRRSR
ncbi:MAG: HEAT repeat domain-containing protein [Planctomycetota bacterium]